MIGTDKVRSFFMIWLFYYPKLLLFKELQSASAIDAVQLTLIPQAKKR